MRQWVLTVIVLTAATAAAPADDWPQFRGINRDGISAETALLKTWPGGGPKRLLRQRAPYLAQSVDQTVRNNPKRCLGGTNS